MLIWSMQNNSDVNHVHLLNKILIILFLKLIYLYKTVQTQQEFDYYDIEINNRLLPKVLLYINNTQVVNCTISSFKNNETELFNVIVIQLDYKNSSLDSNDLNNENSIEIAVVYSYIYSRLNSTSFPALYPMISSLPRLFLKHNDSLILINYYLLTIDEAKKLEIDKIKIIKTKTTLIKSPLNSRKKSKIIHDEFGPIMYVIVVMLWYGIFATLAVVLYLKKKRWNHDENSIENAQTFIRCMEEETVTKTILEQLRNKAYRKKLWDIYWKDRLDLLGSKLDKDETIRLQGINKKIMTIENHKIDLDIKCIYPFDDSKFSKNNGTSHVSRKKYDTQINNKPNNRQEMTFTLKEFSKNFKLKFNRSNSQESDSKKQLNRENIDSNDETFSKSNNEKSAVIEIDESSKKTTNLQKRQSFFIGTNRNSYKNTIDIKRNLSYDPYHTITGTNYKSTNRNVNRVDKENKLIPINYPKMEKEKLKKEIIENANADSKQHKINRFSVSPVKVLENRFSFDKFKLSSNNKMNISDEKTPKNVSFDTQKNIFFENREYSNELQVDFYLS